MLAVALTEMATTYNEATENLRNLISSVAMTSKSLAAASDEASAATRESTTAVDQIAKAIDMVRQRCSKSIRQDRRRDGRHRRTQPNR
jgi:methyl-accepting chemotaxis protein